MINNRKIKLTILELASPEPALAYAGKMFIDFGYNVIKIGEHTHPTVFDKGKKVINANIQQLHHQESVKQASCIIIHQDQHNINNIVSNVQSLHPDIIVLIVHRVSPSFKEKFNDAQILALSGLLSHFGQTDNQKEKDNLPQPPPSLASIVSAIAIVTRLLQGIQNKQKGIIRFSMLHHVMYLGMFHLNSYFIGLTSAQRGTGMLEGGAPFYRIYETKNSYLCVGNIQTKFYDEMISGLNLDIETSQYLKQNQMNVQQWSKMIKVFQGIFKQKTTQQWLQVMQKYDTCITGIYELTPYDKIQVSPKFHHHPNKPITNYYQPKLIPKL